MIGGVDKRSTYKRNDVALRLEIFISQSQLNVNTILRSSRVSRKTFLYARLELKDART